MKVKAPFICERQGDTVNIYGLTAHPQKREVGSRLVMKIRLMKHSPPRG